MSGLEGGGGIETKIAKIPLQNEMFSSFIERSEDRSTASEIAVLQYEGSRS